MPPSITPDERLICEISSIAQVMNFACVSSNTRISERLSATASNWLTEHKKANKDLPRQQSGKSGWQCNLWKKGKPGKEKQLFSREMTKQFLLISSPFREFVVGKVVINPNQFISSDIKHILPCQMHVSAPIFHLKIVMKTITIVELFAEMLWVVT